MSKKRRRRARAQSGGPGDDVIIDADYVVGPIGTGQLAPPGYRVRADLDEPSDFDDELVEEMLDDDLVDEYVRDRDGRG